LGTSTLLHPISHHSSHRRLLERNPPLRTRERVDAIIVPAARPATGLRPAIRLAKELGCPLVALCSQDADPATIRDEGWSIGATVHAVDVRGGADLPRSRATKLLADTALTRRTDTAAKRNTGLALAGMTGWRRILCLDDDITGLDAGTVEQAAGLLADYGVVGLENTGYPDNSVVCHANRDTGAEQGTFIGGGAMLISGARTTSFFPHIYNEDWFFLLDDDQRLADVAVHGKFAQVRFDPYANPTRAGQEEFGDCLAEGLFALLDEGRTVAGADLGFWRAFLQDRRRLIESILKRVPYAPASAIRRDQMGAALRAARTSLLQVEPELCVAYLDAWRQDRARWQRFLQRLPQAVSIEHALGVLGLKA
jgi:hypothetical protein